MEKSWDQMHIKFHNREYFSLFTEAVYCRYQDVSWKETQGQVEGSLSTSSGDPVTLRILTAPRIVIVTSDGNVGWIMNDFQNICKNLIISGKFANVAPAFQSWLFTRVERSIPTWSPAPVSDACFTHASIVLGSPRRGFNSLPIREDLDESLEE